MKHRKKWALAGAGVLVLAAVIAASFALRQTDSAEHRARRLVREYRDHFRAPAPPGAVQRLLIALGWRQPQRRRQLWSIADDLRAVGPQAAPLLIQVIREERHPHVYSKTAVILGAIGPPAVPELLRALKDQDHRVRAAGAQALGEMTVRVADPAELAPVVPALAAALRDEESEVRDVAAWSLGRIGPPAAAATPALARALKDEAWSVRAHAADALREIGPAAREAIPALEVATRDQSEIVRDAATVALQKVRQERTAKSRPRPRVPR